MKIVICGAGIAGLALAKQVAESGAETVLVERAPGPRPEGYMMDFFGPGYDAAREMGLLPAIRQRAYQVDEMNLIDERGRRRAGLGIAQFSDGELCSIMRPDLEDVLREALPAGVEPRYGVRVVGVDEHDGGVRVELSDGAEVDADLLVGADGIHSCVRRLVFGEETRFVHHMGFHTAAFTFDSPEIHREVADRFCLTDTVGRQMGFYGLAGDRVAAFAVHRTSDPALPGDFRSAVRETYGGMGWVVPEALEKCPESGVYYDQVAQVRIPSWSRGRVVLLGDAGYAVSLLAGQGASLAIAGAYVLADRLARADSIPEALADYERMWRPVVEEKQLTGRKAARWFLPASALQLRLRRATLRLAGLPVLDRYVAALLAGKSTALITELRRGARV